MFQLHIQGRDNVAFKIGNQTVLDTNGLGGIQLDSDDGALTTSSTFDSRDVAADGVTADAALPRTGGIMTGVISGFESTGIDDNATSTAITIDVNDNVGIGVTPEAWNASWTALQLGATGFVGSFQAGGTDLTALGSNVYSDGSYKYIETDEAAIYKQQNGTHIFEVAASGTADAAISWTTAMTIDNAGRIGLLDNVDIGGMLIYSTIGSGGIAIQTTPSGNHSYIPLRLRNSSGTVIGSIECTTSSTAFITSSDYRLKTNVMPMSGATAQTKLLKPCNFDWIAGGNVNGFIAHELAEVVPDAVYGTKDAMMDEEYEVTPATDTEEAVMGTRSVPDMQGIDQSKLVPLLTATIQELIARIEALEAG